MEKARVISEEEAVQNSKFLKVCRDFANYIQKEMGDHGTQGFMLLAVDSNDGGQHDSALFTSFGSDEHLKVALARIIGDKQNGKILRAASNMAALGFLKTVLKKGSEI